MNAMKEKRMFTTIAVIFAVAFLQLVLGYQAGKALAKMEAKTLPQQVSDSRSN